MASRKQTGQAYAETEPPLVLFLSRTNAASSILAEGILRRLAQGRVRAASAGNTPAADVNPYALECLAAHHIATTGLRSKPWGEYFGLFKPPVRVLITLADPDSYAAKSSWNHDTVRTVRAHWPTADPGAVTGSEVRIRLAFEETFTELEARIRRFLALPLDRLSGPALVQELTQIGQVRGNMT